MKKKLYFTNAAPPWKSINALNTYVNFVYDTKTGELKLVDCFNGETKEVVIATVDKVAPTAPTVTMSKVTTTDPETSEETATVTVVAEFPDDAAEKLYSIDGGEFQEYPEAGVQVTEDCTIVFKAIDDSDNKNESTTEVKVVVADVEEAEAEPEPEPEPAPEPTPGP